MPASLCPVCLSENTETRSSLTSVCETEWLYCKDCKYSWGTKAVPGIKGHNPVPVRDCEVEEFIRSQVQPYWTVYRFKGKRYWMNFQYEVYEIL